MPTVVVTGAGRGIGRATALRMAGAGWEVVAGVRRTSVLDALLAPRRACRADPRSGCWKIDTPSRGGRI